MNNTNKNIWIIGCGNIGQRVATLLHDQGAQINATSHSTTSIQLLEQLGITVYQANLDEPETLCSLPLSEKDKLDVYYFAPPQAKGDVDLRMTHFLDALQPKPQQQATLRRLVYISTTGVYGNHDGEWITEDTPTEPKNARSKRRLSAEIQIKQFSHKHDMEYIILRVAGIYDLKKLPLERINAGLQVLKADLAPASNRIHAADLANICVAAMRSAHHDCVFNVADGNPSSISDYFIQTAALFNLTPPEEISWEKAKTVLSPEMLSYLSESKKVAVDHIQEKLSITLKYPSLAEGLAACKKKYSTQ